MPGTGGPGNPGAAVHDKKWATLGGVTLGRVDAFGVLWILEDLVGWDTVGTTGQTEQRAADHGGWINPAYYTARLIEITGSLIANDEESATAALSRLSTAIPLSTLDTFTVDEGFRSLQAAVRQEGDPIFASSRGKARFSLSLTAPDPRRYGTVLISASTGLPITTGGLSLPITLPVSIGATVSSGVLSVTNDGDFPTAPVFKITGPCPPGATITLVSTGATLRFAEAIPAGRQLVIDTATQTALLDGIAPRTVTGTWFSYPPGPNDVAFSASSFDPDALLTSEHRAAWR